ncbi:MAG: ComEC/Rec2 family competence protein [Nannocystaceae bacterium]
MATVLLAIEFCVALGLGALLGARSLDPEVAPISEVGILAVGAAVIACLVLAMRAPGRGRVALPLAVALCGGLRGVTAWTPRPLAAPGPCSELVAVEVVGASTPGPRCTFEVRAADGDLPWQLRLPPEACPRSAGEALWIRRCDLRDGMVRSIPGGTLPAQRSRAAGVAAILELDQVWPRAPASRSLASRYWRRVAELRTWAFSASRGDPARGFVVAALLGLREGLSSPSRGDLRAAGLGHLIAVSGMHVGVAALLIRGLLLRVGFVLGRTPAAAAALSCGPVIAYVAMTGGAPSAVRAATMFALCQLATIAGRPGHGITSLVLTAAVLLAVEPRWALSPGFHLSFAAMSVLVHPESPRGLWARSWAITWATAPVSLLHFGTISPYGLLANAVAIPVFTLWIVPTGVVGLLGAPLLGDAALTPAALGAELVLDIAAGFAHLPDLSPRAVGVLALAVIALRAVSARLRRRLPSLLLCLALAIFGLVRAPPRDPAPFDWIVLGQGRTYTLISPVRGRERLVCLRDPTLSAARWPEFLRAIGVSAVASVETRRPGPDGQAPAHVAAIRDHLRARGLLRPDPARCDFPSRAAARALVGACIDNFPGRGIVVARARDQERACFVDGAWKRVHSTQDPV